jgi:hypothetical protein
VPSQKPSPFALAAEHEVVLELAEVVLGGEHDPARVQAVEAWLLAVLIGVGVSGRLAAAPGVQLWAYSSAALFGSTYIMLTGIILLWSVSVFQERPSAGLGAAFLLIAVGQVFGALAAGAVAGAAGLVVTFWAFAGVAVAAALIGPRAEQRSAP